MKVEIKPLFCIICSYKLERKVSPLCSHHFTGLAGFSTPGLDIAAFI